MIFFFMSAAYTTPGARECRFVDVELGLTETTGRNGAGRVAHLLDGGLSRHKFVNESAQCLSRID
jgi:hypothetical protein